jgi:hypothetical protein
MRDHRLAGIEEAEPLEHLHRTQAVALLHFGYFDFVFARMSMKSRTISAGEIDRTPLACFVGIEQMFKPDPHVDPAAGLAVPRLEHPLIVVERVEVVVIGMRAHIRHGNQPIADRFRSARTAIHEAPHVDEGCRA